MCVAATPYTATLANRCSCHLATERTDATALFGRQPLAFLHVVIKCMQGEETHLAGFVVVLDLNFSLDK
ncbi:hypothetical protein A2U01_0036194, partial [Trifolium medium]|nr:hypothetical protein [Trifolium medium]